MTVYAITSLCRFRTLDSSIGRSRVEESKAFIFKVTEFVIFGVVVAKETIGREGLLWLIDGTVYPA